MTSSPGQPSQQPNPRSQDLHWLGAGLIFVAEVLTLLALAWWGFTAIHGPVQVLVGLGLPIAVALLWGTFLTLRWPAAQGVSRQA